MLKSPSSQRSTSPKGCGICVEMLIQAFILRPDFYEDSAKDWKCGSQSLKLAIMVMESQMLWVLSAVGFEPWVCP